MKSFASLVLTDENLAATLAAVLDGELFTAQLGQCARERGIPLSTDAVMPAVRSDPLGLSRWSPPPLAGSTLPPRHWLPLAVGVGPEGAVVDWAWFGPQPLRAPFYEMEIMRALGLPFNRAFRYRTGFHHLVTQIEAVDALEPDGFIFHMSRCGSTLVAQMLAALPDSVVISEAAPLDAVVQLCRGLPDADAVAALRAIVAALGRKRGGHERRLFVKLDAWHALALPLFRRAFPDVPWVFLYREPVEVLVSQMRQRGVQMVQQYFPPRLFGIEDTAMPPDEEYCARVLGAICQAAIDHHGLGGGLLLDYRDLPAAVFTSLLPHFGVSCDETERETMRGVARLDAKSPITPFTADAAAKRREATEKVRRAADRHLAAIYRRLEELRAGLRAGLAGGEVMNTVQPGPPSRAGMASDQ